MPAQFWSLTVREFWIKFRAFVRAENRAEAANIRHALRTSGGDTSGRRKLQEAANELRQYPVKSWIKDNPWQK